MAPLAANRCNWPVGYEHDRDIPCGALAVIRIDRRRPLPALFICIKHMDDRRVYREAQLNGAHWAMIGDGDGG
jgi:hypothetical protein